ncbi:hypothetical protein C8Q77DRAFT_1162074 [Trametes polyzona]|nr:hypothetical protein C8Q77DRAFT_1162074 [Trametes polyzona]
MASKGLPPWPTNQARLGHNVDLRRPWVPSPLVPVAEVDPTVYPILDGDEEYMREAAPYMPEIAAELARAEGPDPAEASTPPSASASAPVAASASAGSSRSSGRKQRRRRAAGDENAAAAGGALMLDLGERTRHPWWLVASCLRWNPKKLFRRSRNVEEDSAALEQAPAPEKREIMPAEWRAYGYWARPFLRYPWTFRVNNATPPDNPRELSPSEVDAMIASLREPGGQVFPENWIPRVKHPSLPPRPDLWPTPSLTYEPLPSEIQLNPWLAHRVVGPAPLYFDLRLRAEDAQMHVLDELYPAGVRRIDLRVDGPNGAQPATHPGVPRLRICALAGDPRPTFWWPVTVLAHHEALPVQVRDVLDALVANFEERIAFEEMNQISEERAQMIHRAYLRRVTLAVGGRLPPRDDGLRRIDYLGDNICFRGLEPAPDGEGFMLFTGPPP